MDFQEFALTPPAAAEERWLEFERFVNSEMAGYFDGEGPIVGARAPGRLDVMGGVADYSGSIVLEMPVAQAACAAWQWRDDRTLRILSVSPEAGGEKLEAEISLDAMVAPDGSIRTPEEVHIALTASPETRWAAYVAGCFYVMLAAYGNMSQGRADSRLGERGANILVRSDVPAGAGVSSSAALEVSTMHALSEAAGIQPSDLTLAAWCQRVENQIVGAPCGIMDQVTSALGKENALLALRCQPHDLLGNQPAPASWRFLGIDSQVKHSVGGGHYTRARVGAFMGLKIIQLESGGQLLHNYLCRMSSAEFAAYKHLLPETITGREFSDLYGLLPDTVTQINPEETYHPRSCAEHPILENEHCKAFIALMHLASMRLEQGCQENEEDDAPDRMLIQEAGDLMYQSHLSYSERLNLGSPETDLLVQLVQQHGQEKGLFGARITGGGSGGTVAILARANNPETDEAILQVCSTYRKETGITPRIFTGSSPGAVQFGARLILRG